MEAETEMKAKTEMDAKTKEIRWTHNQNHKNQMNPQPKPHQKKKNETHEARTKENETHRYGGRCPP